MPRIRSTSILIGTMLFLQACGEVHEFSAGTKARTESILPPSSPAPDKSDDLVINPNPETLPPSVQTPDGEKIPQECPTTTQEVLILDMKSGWWAGDAGDFFKTLLQGLTLPCGDSYIFEFHHVLNNANTYQVFPNGPLSAGSVKDIDHVALKSDWSKYSQIWLLSGSYFDRLDLKTNTPLFQGILQKIKDAGVPLFIGSGNGNITHANALVTGLGLASQFYTILPEGPTVSAKGHFTVQTRLALGAQLTPHPLFAQGIASIADTVLAVATPAGDKEMKSDILMLGEDFTAVGENPQHQPVIAVRKSGGAKVVLDAGIQRFYSIKDTQEVDTLKYLQNITVYLSIH